MLNTTHLNTTLLNGLPRPIAGGLSTDAIRFGSLGLQNANILMNQPIYERSPSRDFITFKKPTRHGRLISSDFWDTKVITLRGTLVTSSEEELDTLIDTMKKSLRTQSDNLDILRGDGFYRRFVCTCEDMDFQRVEHYHKVWTPVELTFRCLVPFGTDIDYTSNVHTTSELIFSETQTNDGTEVASPQFVFIVGTSDSITKLNLKNNTTGQEIEITTAIETGDTIIIDSETLEITKNGTPIQFSGDFPSLALGENSFTATMTGTSIDYSLGVSHLNSYI